MIKIMKYGEVSPEEIFARGETSFDVADIVSEIIDNVKKNGDKALFEYCEKFDKASLTSLEVSAEEIEEAFQLVEPKFIEIIEKAAVNIRKFHEKQVRNSFIISEENGVITGQKVTPIEKVGLYVPGGTAAYPSTVLMDSIPAKIAGCEEICITTPPSADGKVNPVIPEVVNQVAFNIIGNDVTITMAAEKNAYCLSDRGTWLKMKTDAETDIALEIVCEGAADLLNQYGIIAVNPEKYPDVNNEAANAMITWICSEEVQELIGNYGVDTYGQALFTPNANK